MPPWSRISFVSFALPMFRIGRTRRGRGRNLTDPREGQRGSVVVLVQENDFALFQNEDDRIQKLVPFDQVVLEESGIATVVSGTSRDCRDVIMCKAEWGGTGKKV